MTHKRNKCRDGGGSIGAEELGQVCSNKKNRIQRTIQVRPIPISLFLNVFFFAEKPKHQKEQKNTACPSNRIVHSLHQYCTYLKPPDNFFQKVMRTFGWDPSDEDLKDMVNVIDQVDTTLYLLQIKFHSQ